MGCMVLLVSILLSISKAGIGAGNHDPVSGILRSCAGAPRIRTLNTAYRAVQPPSITKLAPVMRDAAGDARNTTAPATSSIRPIRPRGIRLSTQFRNSLSAKNEALKEVSRKV